MDVLCHNPSPSASSPSSPSAAAEAVATAAAAVGDAQYSSPPRATTGSEASSSRGGSGSVGERSCFLGDLITGVLTCIFAVVGSIVGAITGALIGLATESGLLRGAGIGAISGAVFCIEAVESSVAMWRSNGSGIWSVFVLDIMLSLLSGRIVYEKVDPAVQNAVQSQMSAVDAPFREIEDIFETGSLKGLPRDSVDKLPKVFITEENSADASGDRICCSVCLQDFQVGESVRRLPQCQHMFHIPCIDDWLVRHGSCPLCRRNL